MQSVLHIGKQLYEPSNTASGDEPNPGSVASYFLRVARQGASIVLIDVWMSCTGQACNLQRPGQAPDLCMSICSRTPCCHVSQPELLYCSQAVPFKSYDSTYWILLTVCGCV